MLKKLIEAHNMVLRVDRTHPDIMAVMKRAAAFVVYYVGMMLGLGAILEFVRQADTWQFLLLPVVALPIWWITAGIGVRLGVYPSEFFRALATASGLIEPANGRRDTAVER